MFDLFGTRLIMSTVSLHETDVQTERLKRLFGDVLRNFATSFSSWNEFLPMNEFSLNKAINVSIGLIPFYVKSAWYPCVPVVLGLNSFSTLVMGGAPDDMVWDTTSRSELIYSVQDPVGSA